MCLMVNAGALNWRAATASRGLLPWRHSSCQTQVHRKLLNDLHMSDRRQILALRLCNNTYMLHWRVVA